MKLRRVTQGESQNPGHSWLGKLNARIDRRKFLGAAGLGIGLAAVGTTLVRETKAAKLMKPGKPTQIKTICGNCAVGCGFIGEVQEGVWVSQEPWFEHPINQGSLCSKGAAAREHVISEKRLRYPMKKEGGKWVRLSWDQALDEISTKLKAIREKDGPDALMIRGPPHHTTEPAYALRKFAALCGSHKMHHQARIEPPTPMPAMVTAAGQ